MINDAPEKYVKGGLTGAYIQEENESRTDCNKDETIKSKEILIPEVIEEFKY